MSSGAKLIKVHAGRDLSSQRVRGVLDIVPEGFLTTMARWLICVAVSLLYAQAASAQPAAPPPTPILIDRVMSPGAGATVTNGVARLLARGEEQFLPLRLFTDEGKLRRGANAAYRLLKVGLFDDPQENWL